MQINQRHYIHGDQSEQDCSLFYCATCDAFLNEHHFFNKEKSCCDHWNKYDEAMKLLGKSPQNHSNFGRPIDAANVFRHKR
ncbi:hypothetical protein [Shewanella algae]|uniref:hypothetical protein n=1 Tax=Shewanella algae TaxID=38313 RepID=UPI000B8A622D|nr:hypothetical protein [Shewanella algae]MBO2577027.1 hypothetical protein [Shewanella algae]MBO2682570.1 hypothetical protein [Shewanella algae]